MKAKLFVTMAVAAFLLVAIVACSSLKGKEETGTTTPPKTTTPATEVEEGKVTKTVVGDTVTYKGKLRGTNDSNKFDLFLDSDYVEITFDYPSESAFYVKVLGKSGNELGEFDLSQGEIIELSGGGKFSLIVHSQGGGGAWSATYTE